MSSDISRYIFDPWDRLVKVIDAPAARYRLHFHLDENLIAERYPDKPSDTPSPENREPDPPDEPFIIDP